MKDVPALKLNGRIGSKKSHQPEHQDREANAPAAHSKNHDPKKQESVRFDVGEYLLRHPDATPQKVGQKSARHRLQAAVR